MKRFLFTMLFTVIFCIALISLSSCNISENENFTEGLEYNLINDGTAYEVSGIGSSSAKNIIIPEKYNNLPVVYIGEYAFSSYDNESFIESIKLPDNVTSIGNYAFDGCKKLKTIIYSDDLISIGDNAFRNCVNLTNMIIGDSVKSIGVGAFSNCKNLTSLTLGKNITKIQDDAFKGCSKLFEIYNKSYLNIERGSSDNGYVGYNALNVYIDMNIPSKFDYSYNDYIFYTDDEYVYLVGYIGNNDTSINLPKNYYGKEYGIYKNAFSDLINLSSITIPDCVTSIGSSAFSGCNSLESITLPFVGATKNGTSNTHFGYIFGAGSYSDNRNSVPTSLKTVVITGGSSIGSSAFYGCSSITSITIPYGVTNIGSSAFSGCSSITSVTIPYGVTKIDRYAFQGCSSLARITFADTSNWYRTKNSNYTGGTIMNVTDPSTNASYFKSGYFSYCNWYWYKL